MPTIPAPPKSLSQAGRAAHDLGLAGLLGGVLFGRMALHPAVAAISDPRERGEVVNAAWRRYGTVNSLSLAAGLAMLGRRRSAAGGSADLIDAAIVTIGASVVSWVFLISPYVGDTSLRTAERLVAIAYPVGDLLLLAMSAKLFLTPGGRSRAHTTFGLGLLAVLVADVLYAALTLAGSTAIPERFLDTGWLLGYLLNLVFILAEKRFLAWHRGWRAATGS